MLWATLRVIRIPKELQKKKVLSPLLYLINTVSQVFIISKSIRLNFSKWCKSKLVMQEKWKRMLKTLKANLSAAGKYSKVAKSSESCLLCKGFSEGLWWGNSIFSYCDVFGMVSVNTTTATPPDMQPLGGWTLQILTFALDPDKSRFANL